MKTEKILLKLLFFQSPSGASSNEHDEKRIAKSFEQMNKKMIKAGKMASYRAKANKPKVNLFFEKGALY